MKLGPLLLSHYVSSFSLADGKGRKHKVLLQSKVAGSGVEDGGGPSPTISHKIILIPRATKHSFCCFVCIRVTRCDTSVCGFRHLKTWIQACGAFVILRTWIQSRALENITLSVWTRSKERGPKRWWYVHKLNNCSPSLSNQTQIK